MKITLTRAQVREVDRRAVEEFAVPGIVLMENAGRGAAELIHAHARPRGLIAIVCGRGNNGGDGFVIARHLANAEREVAIFLACEPARLTGDAATNYQIVDRMGLARYEFDTAERIDAAAACLGRASTIVDAVLGTGFSGDVRAPLDRVIEIINAAEQATVIAIDVPSGLDCDTGQPSNATVKADRTITFVARKCGFGAAPAAAFTGAVEVVSIGAPASLIREIARENNSVTGIGRTKRPSPR